MGDDRKLVGHAGAAHAVAELRKNIATQEKWEEHLGRKIEQLRAEAIAKKDTRRALFALKRKRLCEEELAKIPEIKMNLERQAMKLESLARSSETTKVMATGREVMTSILKDTKVGRLANPEDGFTEEDVQSIDVENQSLRRLGTSGDQGLVAVPNNELPYGNDISNPILCHLFRSSGSHIFKLLLASAVLILSTALMVVIKSNNTVSHHTNEGDEPAIVNEDKKMQSSRGLQRIHAAFDPSEALGATRGGVIFHDIDGTPKHPIEIFKDHGYTYARLRVMVEPSHKYGLFQDIDYVKQMAQDIVHKYSMKLLLDFHYSHWWTNPQRQWIPLKWSSENGKDTPLAAMKDYVYQHTKSVMEELILQDTVPCAVQIGNEVNTGMLWPTGQIVDGDMKHFVELTNTAIDAMKASFSANHIATSSFPQIVMHITSENAPEEWFARFSDAGGHFDVAGLSYSPQWHGSLQDLLGSMQNIKQVFPDKDVWVVETAYHWTETAGDFKSLPFDQSEDGQAEYLKSLLDVLIDYGHDTAVFYMNSHWTQDSVWINSDNDETWEDVANRSMFNRNATALKGIDTLVNHF